MQPFDEIGHHGAFVWLIDTSFMDVPTFEALNMSTFHSAKGGMIAKRIEKKGFLGAVGAFLEIFWEFRNVEGWLKEGLRFFKRLTHSENFFRTPHLNRRENEFLKDKISFNKL